METIREIIDILPLTKISKEKLFIELLEKKISSVKISQNKAFISLVCGKIIILNNVKRNIENHLIRMEILSQEAFVDSKFKIREERKKIKWLDEEIEYLKFNHQKYTNKELSLKLGKSIYQVQAKKISLKLYPIRQWTIDEIEYLKKNSDKSLYYLSEKLNRSIASIKTKKNILKNSINI